MVAALVAVLLWPFDAGPAPEAARPLPLAGLVVVIDPGHGGIDSGAIASGVQEKGINLAVSLAAAQEIRGLGGRVVLTRTADQARVPLGQQRYLRDRRQRAAMVAESGAQLFVAIHANYVGSAAPSGPLVLWNASANPGGRALAQAIRTALARELGTRVALSRQFIAVLSWSGVPAALVEVGFLSNPGERAMLQNAAYQVRLGVAISTGVRAYWSARRAEETFWRGLAWAP